MRKGVVPRYSPRGAWVWAGLMLAAVLGSGCSTVYVDGSFPEVPTAELTRPASPRPVQLVFEFQTKGVSNAQATAHLKPLVKAQLDESGLFASVADEPVASGALLTLTINNVPLNDDASAKAFLAGFTFGLAGTVVGDGYDSQLRYNAGRDGPALDPLLQKHAIYLKIGSGGPPPNAVEVDGLETAVKRMLRQTLSRLLQGLSQIPAFRGDAAAAATPSTPTTPPTEGPKSAP